MLALPLAAALVGLIAWNGAVSGLCALPLFIFLWRFARSRRWAFLTAAAYYLVAGRGLILGAGVFFGDDPALPSWAYGIAIWTMPSLLLASVWAGLWGEKHRPLRVLAALLITSIPPIGVVGWANPITAAGALFPGTGWFGFALCVAALAYLAQTRRPVVVLVGLAISASVLNARYHEQQDATWMAVNTDLGAAHGSDDDYARLHALLDVVDQRSSENLNVRVFVLPELVGGDWSMNAIWWQRMAGILSKRGQTVLIGALLPLDRNTHYENALFSVGADGGKWLVDRVPVPYSMWKPWTKGGADGHWADSGVQDVAQRRVATLICYEQLLVWPVLHSFMHRPTLLVGAANDWWARGTSISRIQHEATAAWGRLFSVPVVWARNE